jgi:hypothetical protein
MVLRGRPPGWLLIFTEAEAMVLTLWPELEALRKGSREARWASFTPVFRVLRRHSNASPDSGSGAARHQTEKQEPHVPKQVEIKWLETFVVFVTTDIRGVSYRASASCDSRTGSSPMNTLESILVERSCMLQV